MSAPLVCVTVPVYNCAAYLPACLQSLAAQTLGDFVCVLVDDGSTDDSAAVCEAFAAGDPRFVLLRQANAGVSAARAAGVRDGRRRGAQWFAFCDGDDVCHPDFLRVLHAAARKSGQAIACCRYDTFADALPPESPAPDMFKTLPAPAHLTALLHDHAVDFSLCNKLYAAAVMDPGLLANGFAYNEDLVANWRLFQTAAGCAFVDFAGYHYRQHAASASHRALPARSIAEQKRAAALILTTAPDALKASARSFYYEKLVYLASMILRQKDPAPYREALTELRAEIGADLGKVPGLPLPIRATAWATVRCPALFRARSGGGAAGRQPRFGAAVGGGIAACRARGAFAGAL